VAATALAAQSWFHAGTVIATGDGTLPVGTAWLGRLFLSWTWSGSDLGSPSSLEPQLPWAAIVALTQAVGLPSEIAQRFWYSALFVGAAIAAFALLNALKVRPEAAVVGSLAYIFNGYVVSTVSANPVYLCALVLLASFPALLLAVATKKMRIFVCVLLFASSAPLLGYVYLNPPLLGLIGVSVVITSALIAIWLGWSGFRPVLRCAVFAIPLTFALSAYWLLPALVQLATVRSSELAQASSWLWTEGRSTIANALWLNTAWGWHFPEYYPFSNLYGQLPLSLIKFSLPALAFAPLAFSLERRGSEDQPVAAKARVLPLFAATAALSLIILSTGTNAPGSLVFNVLYNLPLGWLLREPGRFLMGVGLCYAVLIALTLDYVIASGKTARRSGVARMVKATAGAVACLLVLAPGFPLINGGVVPDRRPLLPPAHVVLPAYWEDMARYVNAVTDKGSLLVLPPDDFYQMPYRWGYYGNDGFITNMISRHVIIPNEQGYLTTQRELIDAVGLAAQATVDHDWISVQRILRVLGAPFLLVRQDIDTSFPQRRIVSPAVLSNALQSNPNFVLVHRAGPLELFRLTDLAGLQLEIATHLATVDNATPDLRILKYLPEDTALIQGKPRDGVPAIQQLPDVSVWDEHDGLLSYVVTELPGWTYRTVSLGVKRPQTVTSTSHVDQPLEEMPLGSGRVKLSLKTSSVLRNGDFKAGLWNPVGNCHDVLGTGDLEHLDAQLVTGAAPTGASALRLSASQDSACEAQWLSWKGGPVRVSMLVRHVSGDPPRICLWQLEIQRCADTPAIPDKSGWINYRMLVTPDEKVRTIGIFLYADAASSGQTTVNEYAGVTALEISGPATYAVIAQPKVELTPNPIAVLHTTFSSYWRTDLGTQPILVDGLLNGWSMGGDQRISSIKYAPGIWVRLSQLVSLVVAVTIVSAIVIFVGWTVVRRATVRLRRQKGIDNAS
jgi:hypothetical protein